MMIRIVLMCCPPRVLYRLGYPSRNLTDTTPVWPWRACRRATDFQNQPFVELPSAISAVRPFLRRVLTFRSSFFLSLAERLIRCFRLPQIRSHVYFGGLAAVLVELDLHLVSVVAFDDLVLYVIGLVSVD